MEGGQRRRPSEGLDQIRQRFREEWATLPEPYRAIRPEKHYPIEISPALEQLEQDVIRQREREELGRDG
jgi:nicotinate phosphoribosyltransferase